MPPIVTFIGWHDSGKTTLACQVVHHLKQRGYSVAVIKSTKETGLCLDNEGTDTHDYQLTGADAVTLVAPDQMVIRTSRSEKRLTMLAHRYFPDVDLVVGEGFKKERKVAKIEVRRGPAEPLRPRVSGVVAVATDQPRGEGQEFGLDQSLELADFIEKRFILETPRHERTILLVNGNPVPLNPFVQDILAATVQGLVSTLKATGEADMIELRIHPPGSGD